MLPILFLGLAGEGDLVIFLSIGVSTLLTMAAYNPLLLIQLLLLLAEAVVNFLIQYLLRKARKPKTQPKPN